MGEDGAGGTHSCWGALPSDLSAAEEQEGEEAVAAEWALEQAEVTTEAVRISVERGSVEKGSGEVGVGGG